MLAICLFLVGVASALSASESQICLECLYNNRKDYHFCSVTNGCLPDTDTACSNQDMIIRYEDCVTDL